ncbi:MAG: glycoside hydrolase family 31 protein [Woeseiaceae bacterium]
MTNIAVVMTFPKRSLLMLLGICWAGIAQAEFGNYVNHRVDLSMLVIETDRGELQITTIDDSAFEVHYREEGHEQLPSFALTTAATQVRSQFTETDTSLEFSAPGLTAVVQKSPVRIDFYRNGESLLSEDSGYFATNEAVGFRFALDDGEKIMGGGERVLGMDRRGYRMPLYNRAHYGYETESRQMYYGVPAIVSSDRYMIVFDNSANGWLDIGETEGDILQFEAVGGRTSYIVIAGDDYPALVRNYTDVTGRQPMPPRWAFGNFASRFGYRSEKEVRDVVRRFRRQDIPLDAVVIDIYWFGPDIQGHMGNLDWDRDAWPTPEDMIADLQRDGIKTIVVTEPFILSTSKRWQSAVDNRALAKDADGSPYRFDFYFGNTGLVDVFDESAKDWFWQPYKMLFEQGIAGTWGDLGEPEVHPGDARHFLSDAGIEASGDEVHNAFGHEWTRMVYERQVAEYPDMRPMIMMRSGFAGTQRYGIIPWTGDVSRSWGGLKPQVELSLSMGLTGLAYTHSDLGGFTHGVPPDHFRPFEQELYVRWLQYGVFQPVYRPHAQEGVPPEPVFQDRKTRNIVREFINLRYRLLPYIYTLAFENSTSGMPLMRPLFFDDQDDLSLIDNKDAYLWGDAFLVAPVTDAGIASVDVSLPAGTWFDYWNGHRYEGGTTASIPVDLETIPVLVRAGSFVPMIDDIETTDDYSSENLTLHYYADESVRSATGQMYEDDGVSRLSLEQGRYELLKFRARQEGESLTIELERSGGDYDGRPDVRDMEIVIHNWTAPVRTARFDGRTIRVSQQRDNTLTARVDWDHSDATFEINRAEPAGKPVVYQVMTRLFGNDNTTNKPWGTIEENGVGKFADFTDEALEGIRELGTTHIWYTGVPHHAVIRDYTEYGISNDDPDVVKGRAGSPYAVKDYYNVDPDLATDPARRLEEFEELITRTHAHGMKVIIDIVPNHVARNYESVSRPDGVEDFGANDDTSVEWARDNNFYYVVGEEFRVPEFPDYYEPLGGEEHPRSDGEFEESPARWTGNGARAAQPKHDDWYETVKINHGVRPDGSYAFDSLPEEARNWSTERHARFWADKDVPDSWTKFRDIVLYWTAKGVDGFRFDMAEMVPVEFWSFLNSSIKAANPDAFLLAEVYNPDLYRDYLQLGRMDYLYDKVGLYDSLKPVIRGEAGTETIAPVHADVLDIEERMLHFLENHDEERIASPNFAGDPALGKPAMVVSALIGRSPTMIYFGQEVGEDARGNPGFDEPMRNSLYDYHGLPALQRWANDGNYDGGRMTSDERELRDFYKRLLNLSTGNVFAGGDYAALDAGNSKVFAFARWTGDEQTVVVSNFDSENAQQATVEIPPGLISAWQLADGRYVLDDLLSGSEPKGSDPVRLIVDGGSGYINIDVQPLESAVWRIGDADIVRHTSFASQFVGARHIDVWLPRDYATSDKDYRVLYFHDGQNLFNPEWVYYTQTDWDIDTTLQELIDDGEADDTIVVGIWSTSDRISDYMPHEFYELASDEYRNTANQYMTTEPNSRNYLRFMVEELKPFIDANYRTRRGRDDTFLMGSSAGGMISLYGIIEYPDVFGGAACISTHWPSSMMRNNPQANEPILEWLRGSIPAPGEHRIYFDFGTAELDSEYEPHQQAVDNVMRELGYETGPLWQTRKFEGAGHNEGAWQERAHIPLKFLLGPADNKE